MVFTFAATPPSISVVHTSTGPIYGGVSSGTDGVIYFSTQFQSPNRARVTALNPNTTVKWVWEAPSTGSTHNIYGVNRFGQVVGRVQNDSGVYRAFLFTPGGSSQLTDLNTLVLDGGATPQSLGWSLSSAVSISGGGIMVGLGSRSGATKSWIIYPKVQD